MDLLFLRAVSEKCTGSPRLKGRKKQEICMFILIQYANTLDMAYQNLVLEWRLNTKSEIIAAVRVNQNLIRGIT